MCSVFESIHRWGQADRRLVSDEPLQLVWVDATEDDDQHRDVQGSNKRQYKPAVRR